MTNFLNLCRACDSQIFFAIIEQKIVECAGHAVLGHEYSDLISVVENTTSVYMNAVCKLIQNKSFNILHFEARLNTSIVIIYILYL